MQIKHRENAVHRNILQNKEDNNAKCTGKTQLHPAENLFNRFSGYFQHGRHRPSNAMTFFIYDAAAALIFNQLFFPNLDPLTGVLAAFATYAVGFIWLDHLVDRLPFWR